MPTDCEYGLYQTQWAYCSYPNGDVAEWAPSRDGWEFYGYYSAGQWYYTSAGRVAHPDPATLPPLVIGTGLFPLGSDGITVVGNPSDVYASRLTGEFTGWTGNTVFVFDNGQVWQQTEYAYLYQYAYRPRVYLFQSESSGWRLRVEGVTPTIAVRRLR